MGWLLLSAIQCAINHKAPSIFSIHLICGQGFALIILLDLRVLIHLNTMTMYYNPLTTKHLN